MRLQDVGHRTTVFNACHWDCRLLWAMFALSQRAAPNLRARWLLLRALLSFFTRTTGWLRPRRMAKRYSTLLPDEIYLGAINWLAQRPRFAAALRRVTGLKLRPPTPEKPNRLFNGAHERDSSGPRAR